MPRAEIYVGPIENESELESVLDDISTKLLYVNQYLSGKNTPDSQFDYCTAPKFSDQIDVISRRFHTVERSWYQKR